MSLMTSGSRATKQPMNRKPIFLGFARAEPGHAQRDEDDDGDVRAGQGERPEEGGDGRKGGHVDSQGHRHDGRQGEPGGDAQPGGKRAANQALLEVERNEGVEDLQRAGQDQRLHDALAGSPRVRTTRRPGAGVR